MNSIKNVKVLMKKFDLRTDSRKTLEQAFYHSSYTNELKSDQLSNERLEFLGDSVLNLIIAEYLYNEFPTVPEGELTKKRAQLVNEEALYVYANEIDLSEYLYLGKGEEKTGGRSRTAIVGDAFEAFIGAIFLTHGYDKARKILLRIFRPAYEKGTVDGLNLKDYKSAFQELVQIDPKKQIFYEVISEDGPPHNRKYVVHVLVDDIVYGVGEGKSKKDAEQQAAYEAINKLVKK